LDKFNLDKFKSISLSEMDSVSLMKRVDTKFIIHKDQIPQLLDNIHNDYRVLEINKNLVMTYKSNYFDTPNAHLYHLHHNGKASRVKVRIRNYVESNLFFLEVKQKSNKGNTKKSRIAIQSLHEKLDEKSISFIHKLTGKNYPLTKSINNQFNRFTLVNNQMTERVTIDTNLSYNAIPFDENLVILELKQSRHNRHSPVHKSLKNMGVKPLRISKYCMGMAKNNPSLKQNSFKIKFKKITKITNS
jgi:hypothetical protein